MRMRSPFATITHAKQRAFLTAYAMTGLLTAAAKAAHYDRGSRYDWLRQPAYKAAFAEAKAMAADTLEEEATRRALGWEETHYTADGTPYPVRKYSDTLLIVRLKTLKPQECRENSHVQVDSAVTLYLEDRMRQANERIARLRRHGTPAPS